MRKNLVRRLLLLTIALAVVGCGKKQAEIVGKWRAIRVENRETVEETVVEFFADGKIRIGSSQLLDWKLAGRELWMSHPDAPTRPIRANVSFRDEQHLEFTVLDLETGKPASCRQFERVVEAK
jgi:hypothetical protein